MSNEELRRTEKVSTPIRIQVVGTDPLGSSFVEETVPLALGREGARIVLRHSLTGDQEITVRNLESGAETDMRVLGQIKATPEGYHYAVELLDPAVNIWGIDFPLTSESEKVATKILLECVRCQGRSLVPLHPFARETFEVQGTITLPCPTCRDRTFWKRAAGKAETVQGPERPAAPSGPTSYPEMRRNKRLPLHLKACIRSKAHGDDLVPTSNISKGGFGFESGKLYALGTVVEVCAPYSPGTVNIFSHARIASVKPLPNEAGFSYGVAYLRGKDKGKIVVSG